MASFNIESRALYSFNGQFYIRSIGGVSAPDTIFELSASPDGVLNLGEPVEFSNSGPQDDVPEFAFRGTYTDADGMIFYMFESLIAPGTFHLTAIETLAQVQAGSTSNFPNQIDTLSDPGWSEAATPICFAEDTLISTPQGATQVCDLRIGDLVSTADGGAVPVKWLGRQTLVPRFYGARAEMVRIGAGALGSGVPQRDLTVTGDHGMVIDGLVINASVLVNGSSIDWVPVAALPDRFTVYHVETEAHDVILANGAPSETFIDYLGRQHFDNHAEYTALYGEQRVISEMEMPRISSERLLPAALRARLGIAAEQAA